MEGDICTISRGLSGQHLPFLSKSPLFKGISENQHLPSHLPYSSSTPPVTPPIIRLLSCTGGLWEVYGRCCTKTSRLEVPLYKGVFSDLGRCWTNFALSVFCVPCGPFLYLYAFRVLCVLGEQLSWTFLRANQDFR